MSFFSKVGNWFKKTAVNIFDLVKAFVRSDQVRDLFRTELGQIVQAVVAELKYENITNDEKREAAVGRILTKAVESGLDVKEGLVRFLIELSIQRLKAVGQ